MMSKEVISSTRGPGSTSTVVVIVYLYDVMLQNTQKKIPAIYTFILRTIQ